MKKENIIREKSYKFAIRIVNLYKHLTENKKEYVLAKQVLRSGTAIGAMVEEAIEAESTDDFIHKLSIFNFQFSISSDPLFEKYYGWSPYLYSMNNPVNAKDGNGKEVILIASFYLYFILSISEIFVNYF